MTKRKNSKPETTNTPVEASNENLYGTTLVVREDEMTGMVEFTTKSTKRSDSVSKSWADPAVRVSRLQRHAVVVDGVSYSSVAMALKALGLPASKIISLRGKLVKNGPQELNGHKFSLAA